MSQKTAHKQDAFEKASNSIDINTALSFIESNGYACVKSDQFTGARLHVRQIYLDPTEISMSVHALVIAILVLCIYRVMHLRTCIRQAEVNMELKNKKK